MESISMKHVRELDGVMMIMLLQPYALYFSTDRMNSCSCHSRDRTEAAVVAVV